VSCANRVDKRGGGGLPVVAVDEKNAPLAARVVAGEVRSDRRLADAAFSVPDRDHHACAVPRGTAGRLVYSAVYVVGAGGVILHGK
jgi:hypothetical protein